MKYGLLIMEDVKFGLLIMEDCLMKLTQLLAESLNESVIE